MAESPILAIPQVEENQDNKHITMNTGVALLEASQEDHYINAAVGAGADTLTEAEATQYILYKLSGLTGAQNLVFPDTINGNTAKRKFLVWNADTADTLTVKGTAAGTTVAVPAGGKVWIVQQGADMAALTPIFTGTAPYDFGFFFPGIPTDTQLLARYVAVRDFTIPANMVSSRGHIGANPTGTYDIDVKLDGSTIGTISISTLGVFTFTTVGGVAVPVVAGERISFFGASPDDATASDIAVTILADRSA